MEVDNRNHWVILRFRFGEANLRSGLRPLWVSYEDSLGRRRSVPRPSALKRALKTSWRLEPDIDLFSHEFGSPFNLVVPSDFQELVEDLALRQSISLQGNAPTSLPVFVEAPEYLEAFKFGGTTSWRNIAQQMFRHFAAEQLQTVRSSGKNKGVKRTPFALPFRVLAIGETCWSYTRSLRHSSWYWNIADVQNHGIVFGDYSLKEVTVESFKNKWDIILADSDSISRVLTLVGKIPAKSNLRPRLIIYFDDRWQEFAVKSLKVPSGVAFLWVPTDFIYPAAVAFNGETFFKRFFYEIIHDKPLHEALRLSIREHHTQRRSETETLPLLLVADPNSNNSLRISDALIKLAAQETKIRKWRRLGELDQFLERTGGELSPSLQENLILINLSRQNISESLNKFKVFKEVSLDYGSEYKTIVPMSGIAETLTIAKEEDVKIRKTIAAVVQNPSFVEEIRTYQERRVDIAVSHLIKDSDYETLDGSKPLRSGERYRVQVHVGHRSPESVVMGDVPPVDPLLPDTKDGHRLEIAFFEKDFVLLSPAVRPMFLPSVGGSEPVFFEFHAPENAGVAEARIGVYYENHLLQSFLLTANVASDDSLPEPLKIKLFVATSEREEADGSETPEEKWVETVTNQQVLARLVFTRTARFANLEELGRREISIGLNSDANGIGHTFMVKADGKAQSVNFPEKILDQQTENFRKFLISNLADGNNKPLFPSEPALGDESKESFKAALRDLIELGESLYNKLFTSLTPDMQDKLRRVADAEDKTIQIVRYDHNYVFPWLALYDYQLPTKIAGAPAPPVCLGYDQNGVAAAIATAAPTKKCSHKWTDDLYCVYGLWGLRHQVEQLVDLTGEAKDAATKIVPAGSSVVQLAVGTDDSHTVNLATNISRDLGTSFKKFDTSENLIDLMWNDSDRPAILIVLGHQQTQRIGLEPSEPRIVLVPNKKWLIAQEILKRLKIKKRWSQQPSTLVLLMACSAGATELSTLNNFVTALTSAGAGAVAGTECLVFSSMAARFAREVTIDMWNEKTLGEAVKLFYRRLMTKGNPVAFAFNYLGDAGLVIDKNSLGQNSNG